MKKNIILHLRICYWISIIADGITAISMAYFQFYNFSLQPSDFVDDKYTSLGLMIGWTCLLFWADRKPLERKDILLLTVFPVLFILMGTEFVGIIKGIVKDPLYIPIIIFQAVLSTYLIMACLTASSLTKEPNN